MINNRIILLWTISLLMLIPDLSKGQNANTLLLKNYRPESKYKIPVTEIQKPACPVIDMHSHDWIHTTEEISDWVKTMDACGIEKTILLTYKTGAGFDSVVNQYSAYKDRFELWCGFDYTGYTSPEFGPNALKELERCYKRGARGVGELGDKGKGEFYSRPVPAYGMHPDDPKMKPIYAKCAELGMPVNIHVADPIWMYQKIDSANDGLMCAQSWAIDTSDTDILGFYGLVASLEKTVRENPATTFIACHFANCMHDLSILARLFDQYPNLYADISARFAETAAIPRYMADFYMKYQDKLLYGTDMGYDSHMYRTTFRILESADEHFYEIDLFEYHWPMSGFGLPKTVLQKIYHDNALKIHKEIQ